MSKAYIHSWKPDVPPNDNRNVYTFCSKAEVAAAWPLREFAEVERMELNRGVTIPYGGLYVCREFHVEERTPEEFVIYCEIPFDL